MVVTDMMQFLTAAGVKGRKPKFASDVENAGATYLDQPVVIDGKPGQRSDLAREHAAVGRVSAAAEGECVTLWPGRYRTQLQLRIFAPRELVLQRRAGTADEHG